MKLTSGSHLAYCTNIHRGETWEQTFGTLRDYSLAVRDRVAPGQPFAIGLRLGDQTSRELAVPAALGEFRRWLERENCYVFTVNGFPHGRFHGGRVKEDVYLPDWTSPARVDYTNRLFDLLAELLPAGAEGSVSTVPCSYKEFITSPAQVQTMRDNIWRSVEHIARLSEKTGKDLHLGLEPEPLCYLETSSEAVEFFGQLRADHPNDPRLDRHLGVNYDACHLAIEYEQPADAVRRFRESGVKISKLHFSSALKVRPEPKVFEALRPFVDAVYFHQVLARAADGSIVRHKDLDIALDRAARGECAGDTEWRIHFHVPLHSPPTPLFGTTSDHIQGLLDILKADPGLCRHIEMETYTWEVMPPEMKNRNVVDQLVSEYEWTLRELRSRGLA